METNPIRIARSWTKRGGQCLMIAPQLWTSLTRQALNRRLELANQLGDTAKEVAQYCGDTLITVAETGRAARERALGKISRLF